MASYVRAQTWTALTNPPPTGLSHCLLLTDATVICQSSSQSVGRFYRLTPDFKGSYQEGTWSQIANVPAGYEPVAYGSVVLADGRVLLVGGEYDGTGNFVLSNRVAVYNPVTNVWTEIAPPTGWSYIGDVTTIVLPNGKVLVGNKLDKQLALLDPSTLTWTVINPSGKIDGFNSEEAWSLLPDGSIFTLDVQAAPNSERYIPSTATWVSAGPTPIGLASGPDIGPITVAPGVIYTPPGEVGPAIRLPNGNLFVQGGNGRNAIFTPPPGNSTSPGTWTAAPSLPSGLAVDDGPSAILPNGHVLMSVSPPESRKGLVILEFDGANLIRVPSIPNAAADASNATSLLLLPTGQIMLVDTSNSVQLYTSPGTYDPSWAPSITSVPPTLTSGATYQIAGTQFNGLSMGTGGGDELENATNYPLVRITNNASGHVYFARTHDHSTMGIATGNVSVSTNFDVPANTELGPSTIAIVANGIPSALVATTIANSTPPAVVLTCPAAAGQLNIPYVSAATAVGGQPPFTFSITQGSLPVGLALNFNTGAITGPPTTDGVSHFSVRAVDSFSTPASVSVDCTVTVTVGPAVGFVKFDSTTQGNWKGAHGQDGWIIPNDSSNIPAYAKITPANASMWTWAGSTADPRALLKGASSTDRIASTYYSSSTFSFDIELKDGQTHQLAFYSLDFETHDRTQTITILDAFSHAVLDTRNMSFMQGGIYAVWNLKGHVIVQITCTGGTNAVVGGIFFRTEAAVVPPPVVTLTSSPPDSSGIVSITAHATSSVGITSLKFMLDGANLGSLQTGPGSDFSMTFQTGTVSNGSHTLGATALDTLGQSATGTLVINIQNSVPAGASAVFVKSDASTQGNWKGKYGSDGYIIANDSSSLPSYGGVGFAGASLWTWVGSSNNPRALLKGSSATDRIASTFYGGSIFTFDVNLQPGLVHQVALYALDMDGTSRAETIAILDASTNQLLASTATQNFHDGLWTIWNIQGHVLIRVTSNGSPNAVISGIFFAPSVVSAPVPPPTVSMTSPVSGASASGSVVLSATASSSIGLVSGQFLLDDQALGAPINGAGPYSMSWDSTQTTNGAHILKAKATDTQGQSTTSSAVNINVANAAPVGPSVVFVGKDTTTRGTWKNAYGQDGVTIAGDSNTLPSYANIAVSGGTPFVWTLTSDPRALQQVTGASRIASVFYAPQEFTIDLSLTGGTHRVALYFLDWDNSGRAQTVSVINPTNQQVLNSQSLSGFQQGAYLTWNISGHVSIKIQRISGNAVVSGILLGP